MGFRVEDFVHDLRVSVPTSEMVVKKADFRGQLLFEPKKEQAEEELVRSDQFRMNGSIDRSIQMYGMDPTTINRAEVYGTVLERMRGIREDLNAGALEGEKYPVTVVEDSMTDGESVDSAYRRILSGEAGKNNLYGETPEDVLERRVQLELLGFVVGRAGNINNGLYSYRNDFGPDGQESITLYQSPRFENVYLGVLLVTDGRNGAIISEDIYVGQPKTIQSKGMRS